MDGTGAVATITVDTHPEYQVIIDWEFWDRAKKREATMFPRQPK